MGKREKAKLEKKKQREELQRNLVYKENCESVRLRSFLLGQGAWLAIMMLMIYTEVEEKESKFPGFWRLMYIWDDYLPMVYILGLFWFRHRVIFNHAHLTVAIVSGFLPPVATSLWYLLDLCLHTIEFGFPFWEKYPLGFPWWISLTISHLLRWKTIQSFVGLLTTWVIKSSIENVPK